MPLGSLMIANCAIVHRFVKLSDAFCLLLKNDNLETAHQLLRLLLDCQMKLFVINTSEKPYELCDSLLNFIEMNKLEERGIKLTDHAIIQLMVESGWYKGVDEMYKDLSRAIHYSYKHIIHLIGDMKNNEMCIGGSLLMEFTPLLDKSLSDFKLLQSWFIGTLHWI